MTGGFLTSFAASVRITYTNNWQFSSFVDVRLVTIPQADTTTFCMRFLAKRLVAVFFV